MSVKGRFRLSKSLKVVRLSIIWFSETIPRNHSTISDRWLLQIVHGAVLFYHHGSLFGSCCISKQTNNLLPSSPFIIFLHSYASSTIIYWLIVQQQQLISVFVFFCIVLLLIKKWSMFPEVTIRESWKFLLIIKKRRSLVRFLGTGIFLIQEKKIWLKKN